MPSPALTVVLDTHVWIWVIGGGDVAAPARAAILAAAKHGEVLISAITVWEVGMLEAKGRLALDAPTQAWVERALGAPGTRLAELTPAIALESSRLPGAVHGDPADRILVATARRHDAVLVTRDQQILAYGAAGFVAVLAA